MGAELIEEDTIIVSVINDVVLLQQGRQAVRVPFETWNKLIVQIGHRTPTVDPEDGPP